MKRLIFVALVCLACAFAQDKTAVSDHALVVAGHTSGAADGVQVGPNSVTVRVIRNGRVISEHTNHNLKTLGGVDALFKQAFAGTQPAPFNYLYLSTNSTAPSASDCAAGVANCTLPSVLTGNGLAPAQATFAHTNGTSTATLTYTWTAATAGTSNIQEAAICNNATPGSGTCAFENTFTPVSLNVGDQLQITWTITIS